MTKQNMEECLRQYEVRRQQIQQEIDHRLNLDLLDEDGYPTEDALYIVEHWVGDAPSWLRLVKSLWNYAEMTWDLQQGEADGNNQAKQEVQVSTFGWSGNESLIGAMERNFILWSMHWVQSRRGGHYIFEIDAAAQL